MSRTATKPTEESTQTIQNFPYNIPPDIFGAIMQLERERQGVEDDEVDPEGWWAGFPRIADQAPDLVVLPFYLEAMFTEMEHSRRVFHAADERIAKMKLNSAHRHDMETAVHLFEEMIQYLRAILIHTALTLPYDPAVQQMVAQKDSPKDWAGGIMALYCAYGASIEDEDQEAVFAKRWEQMAEAMQ